MPITTPIIPKSRYRSAIQVVPCPEPGGGLLPYTSQVLKLAELLYLYSFIEGNNFTTNEFEKGIAED